MSTDQPTGGPMGEKRRIHPVNDPSSGDGAFPLILPLQFHRFIGSSWNNNSP